MATTYHDSRGRFSSKDSAKVVIRDGDRFKVVRQHRRIGGAKPRPEQTNETIQRMNRARAKLALMGALSGPGWVNVSEVIADEDDDG